MTPAFLGQLRTEIFQHHSGESVHGAQRGAQIVGNGIRKRLKFLVGGFQFGGAIDDALFQFRVQPVAFRFAAREFRRALLPGCPLAPQFRQLEVRPHAGQQFTRGKRFGEVIVRAHFQPADRRFLAGARGQQDDGNVPRAVVRAEFTEDAEAVKSRHHDVGEDEIGRVRN